MDDITGHAAIARDLCLIKVSAAQDVRSQVLELANVFRARVVDIAPDSIILEITGFEEKVDRLLEMLRPFGLMEVVRTGQVAMRRGMTLKKTHSSDITHVADDGTVSYSV